MTTNAPTAAPDLSTDSAAHAFVAGLDWSARDNLIRALRDAEGAIHEAALLDIVRATLGDDLPHVAGVIFTAGLWENGHFLDENGRVLYTDGRDPEEVEFLDAGEHLTELHGNVGGGAGLAVIPASGETEFVDCGAEFNLEPWVTSQTTRTRQLANT